MRRKWSGIIAAAIFICSALALFIWVLAIRTSHNEAMPIAPIPSLPPLPQVTIQEAQRVTTVAQPMTRTLKEHTAPQLDDTGLPYAWILQVGTFDDRQKAQKLANKLVTIGYYAFIQEREHLNKPIVVYVGPKIDFQRTQQIKHELYNRLNLITEIYPYSP